LFKDVPNYLRETNPKLFTQGGFYIINPKDDLYPNPRITLGTLIALTIYKALLYQ